MRRSRSTTRRSRRVERAVVGQPRLIVEVHASRRRACRLPNGRRRRPRSSARCSSDAAGRRSARCGRSFPTRPRRGTRASPARCTILSGGPMRGTPGAKQRSTGSSCDLPRVEIGDARRELRAGTSALLGGGGGCAGRPRRRRRAAGATEDADRVAVFARPHEIDAGAVVPGSAQVGMTVRRARDCRCAEDCAEAAAATTNAAAARAVRNLNARASLAAHRASVIRPRVRTRGRLRK